MQTKRLYFIDAVRAFAILMMLQGHFVDTLLAPEYRDTNSLVYNTWSYFRGITAPTFFTISGLIFTYLLIRAKEKGQESLRIRKGLQRGLMLIAIGYLLRIPFLQWFIGEFNTYFLVVDVLQCIGLSLILIIVLYVLCLRNILVFSILCFVLGILIFLSEPLYRNLNIDGIPLVFSNYISKENGSIFTIIPWFGYMAFGGYLATAFYRHIEKSKFKPVTVISFLVVGYLLMEWSSYGLNKLYYATEIELFQKSANYNYLFTRLGNVFIYFGLFYGLERFLKKTLILKIGQKTLSIYVIHFIIIYGSFTGFGLNRLIGKTLEPYEAVLGAILFLVTVCTISFHYVKTNAFVYSHVRRLWDKLKGLPEKSTD
ncbi:heparan-alpha-glucosaminide N-acetyltransferase domain-containing protein [Winogradskyella maritima]|uniref:Heparan-alpha-glucosaminide N-acetyltransferase domain-containing protein n=1 Tax=Winogradskyella maritima TaxID=1517766 RepID=A0ABV8AMJ1_9FLAO|nr:heparan-alpha-glucosaminide N-acetyltransferase domain-containing protein [Winogradskyella maritima]